MQVSVEAVGTLGRRLTVAVPSEEVEKEYSSRLARLSKQVKMSGFRPGKVPLRIVEAQYGASLMKEVAGDVIQSSLARAIGERGLRPAGGARIENSRFERGKGLEYTAEIELYPELKKLDFRDIRIERPLAAITAEDIEHTIETIRRQRAAWNPVTRPAQNGDRLIIDFVGRLDGKEFDGGSVKGYTLVLGTGTLAEGLERGLVRAKGGDVHTIPVTFPVDYRHAPLAGRLVDFEVKVHEVAEPVPPALDENFVRQLGVADGKLESLKSEIRANLEREAAGRARAVLRARALKALLAANPFEAPKGLLEDETSRMRQLDQMAHRPPAADETYRARARTRVALGLILGEVIRARGLKPDAAKVRARIEEMAAEYEDPRAFIQWYYEKPGRLAEVEALVMEERVVEELLKEAEVRDEPVGFQDLLGLEAVIR